MAIRFRRPAIRLPSAKGLLLFALPLPVLLAAIVCLAKGSLPGLLANAAGYALFLVGALLTRRGLSEAAEYQRRRIALAPSYPLKTLGGLTVAVATGLTAWLAAGYSPGLGVGFGLTALLGCYLVYGFDPRTDKHATDSFGLDTTDQVVQALAKADQTIAVIEQASRRIRNPELISRLDRITALARQILTVLEEDPRDLRRARKFLNVYLEGAEQVSQGYVRLHQNAQSPELEVNFRTVLVTIEEVFQEQYQKLLQNDLRDLDVKIEVLQTQLKREGVV